MCIVINYKSNCKLAQNKTARGAMLLPFELNELIKLKKMNKYNLCVCWGQRARKSFMIRWGYLG